MLPLTIHPDVYNEVSDAFRWYEGHARGLGEDFIAELDDALALVQRMPNTWPILSSPFRRFLLKRFPFGVIYTPRETEILVVAVMHLSRKPGYWQQRVE
jgi:toxin ParE1/3/4